MKTIPFLISFYFLSLASCSDEGVQNIPCNETNIVDEWNWLKTEGGRGGLYLTPENTGWNIRLEIGDSIWREFKNDTLTFESKYTFALDSNSLFYGGKIDFENPSSLSVEIIHCILNLQSAFADSPISYYQRKK